MSANAPSAVNGATDAAMRGQVCLVTGATSGIGLFTPRELARRGATVVLVAATRPGATPP